MKYAYKLPVNNKMVMHFKINDKNHVITNESGFPILCLQYNVIVIYLEAWFNDTYKFEYNSDLQDDLFSLWTLQTHQNITIISNEFSLLDSSYLKVFALHENEAFLGNIPN